MRPGPQGALEGVWDETALVDGDRLDDEPESMDQVADARPARILDDDPVADPELRLERALDRVERPSGDGDVAADAVGRELGLGQSSECGELRRDAVEPVGRVDAGERLRQRRKEP